MDLFETLKPMLKASSKFLMYLYI